MRQHVSHGRYCYKPYTSYHSLIMASDALTIVSCMSLRAAVVHAATLCMLNNKWQGCFTPQSWSTHSLCSLLYTSHTYTVFNYVSLLL